MEALGNLALDTGRKYVNLGDNLRSLETKLQRLSNRKIDFESKVEVAERSGTKKRKREVENWFDEVAKIENKFVALKKSIQEGGFLENAISSGKRVEKMDKDVEQLMVQSDSDHFGELCLEASESRGESRETTELFGEMFRKGLETIPAWLDTNEILTIGIWGMGGVGKTTLAEHIHNHLLENTQFKVYWISVSQDFTIKRLQGDVAKRLRLDLSDVDDERVRAQRLRDAFEKMEEMVVLMLDDVWEEFRLKSLGIDAKNCRLILTTRSVEVCNRMQCQKNFELKTLDTKEAWGLFERTLGSETVLDGLKDIAKSITERCDGLPLGIVTVAGSMRGVRDICEWRNALEDLKACSVGYDEMERDVFPILEWSFNRLNKCERNCFLYCCLYPEDWKIKRKELIDLFIGAKLMSKRESWSKAFDEGQTILNKLIRVCLLEKTKDFEGDECVKMHDLVRDMALRITHGNSKPKRRRDVPRFLVKSLGQEDSQLTLEQEEWTQDLRAVSFYSQHFKGIEIPPAWSPNCPKLSTLLLSQVFIREIADSFFRHMCGLKVLNLSSCEGITQLPNSVSDMVNLTALILGGCQGLRFVPPLGKLKQLRIVDLSSTQIRDLPQGLESLVNLERLNLGRCEGLRFVPPLGKLKQLRDLDLSNTKIEDLPEGWESLVNLERFNLNECRSLRRKIIISKGTFSQFRRLQLLVLPRNGRVQVNDPEVLNQLESYIGCLSFTDFCKITRWPKYYHVYINDILTKDRFCELDDCGNQKELYFHQCKLGRGSNSLPDDMKSLIIEECEGIRCLSDVFKNFTNLSDLSKLVIRDLVGIEFLWQLSSASPRDQLEVSSFSSLCGLKWLALSRLPNLVGLFYGESEPSYLLPVGTFYSLRELRISGCHNMKQLFTVQLLQNLQNLKALGVEYCEGLEEIAEDGNGVGQGGGEGIQLTSSGAAATVIILPKLRLLLLKRLPQLKNICKAAMICDSIKEIKIFDCPKVKRLPLFLPTINGLPSLPSTLSKIRGDKEWWESLEWDYPSAKNALDPYFTTQRWGN